MGYVNVQSVNVQNNQDGNYNRLNVSVSFTVPSAGITQTQNLDVAMTTNNI